MARTQEDASGDVEPGGTRGSMAVSSAWYGPRCGPRLFIRGRRNERIAHRAGARTHSRTQRAEPRAAAKDVVGCRIVSHRAPWKNETWSDFSFFVKSDPV